MSIVGKCLKYYLITSMNLGGAVGGVTCMIMAGDDPKSKFIHHMAGFTIGATFGSICGPIMFPYAIYNFI